jgi:hypothetical protein
VRLLIWHVSHFGSTPGQRGRSPVADAEPWPVTMEEGLLVFAAAEPEDEADPAATGLRAANVIQRVAGQVKVQAVVLHSFAHLFGELGKPEAARAALAATHAVLMAQGFTVQQTPFGWFNALDIQAKGHPLSRVSRVV